MERIHSHPALRIAIAAGLGLCLSLPLAAQDMTQGTRLGNRADKVSTTTAPSKNADKRFLDKATKDNEKEVAAATLGQQKAGAPDVRTYAEHLLRDHQDMLVKLDETAVALGVATDRRYVAMGGWGSGLRDGTQPHPAQDDIAASSAGPGSSNLDKRTGVTNAGVTAAAGGNTGDDLANSTGSAVGQGGTAGKAATAAGGTRTAGSVTGRGTTATASMGSGTGYDTATMASTDRNASATATTTQAVPASASEDPAVRKLAAQSGAAFDRAFVDHMVQDHKKAIAEFERASKDSSLSPETRELASNALPKLRNHLAMAETLQVNLKTAQ